MRLTSLHESVESKLTQSLIAIESSRDGDLVEVEAMEGWGDQRHVASLSFVIDGDMATANEVFVNREFRRQGVASWLYNWVEENYNVGLYHSTEQSEDGKAFQAGRKDGLGLSEDVSGDCRVELKCVMLPDDADADYIELAEWTREMYERAKVVLATRGIPHNISEHYDAGDRCTYGDAYCYPRISDVIWLLSEFDKNDVEYDEVDLPDGTEEIGEKIAAVFPHISVNVGHYY